MRNFIDFKDYNECEDIGVYCAFLKHLIVSECYTALTQNNKHLFEGSQQVLYYSDDGYPENNFSSLSKAARLDYAVWSITFNSDIKHFLFEIENITAGFHFSDTYMLVWTEYIIEMLEELQDMPEIFLRNHLRNALHYAYNEAYEGFSERIGAARFKYILGVSRESFDILKTRLIPPPVQMIDSRMPVWTYGQALYCKTVFDNKSRTKQQIMESFKYYPQTFRLDPDPADQTENDEEREQEQVYSFINSVELYSFGDRLSLHTKDGGNINDALKVVRYIGKRYKYIPELHFTLGWLYLENGQVGKAKESFEKAQGEFESIFPENFKGLIDDRNADHYHFSLLYLAYIHYLQGDLDKSLGMMEYLQSKVTGHYLNFEAELDILRLTPNKFGNHIKSEFLKYETVDIMM